MPKIMLGEVACRGIVCWQSGDRLVEYWKPLQYIYRNTVMEFLDSITGALGGVNFVLIFQLVCLALIVVAGPVVIFLLAARGGDM